MSVIGIIGIILLIGIVKKNGIMLVDFAIAEERDRHAEPIAAIRKACLLRFRPILMTTAAALLAGSSRLGARNRHRFGASLAAAWLRDVVWRTRTRAVAHALHDAGRVSLSRSLASLVSTRQTQRGQTRRNIGGCSRIGLCIAAAAFWVTRYHYSGAGHGSCLFNSGRAAASPWGSLISPQ